MAEAEQEILKVRDRREPGHFWGDNEIFDIYFPKIGPVGFSVYMLLCKLAMGTPICDPSIPEMAKILDLDEKTIKKAIPKLIENNLIISTPRQEYRNGRTIHLTNVYTLLAVPKKPHQKPKEILPQVDPINTPPLGEVLPPPPLNFNPTPGGKNDPTPGGEFTPLLKEEEKEEGEARAHDLSATQARPAQTPPATISDPNKLELTEGLRAQAEAVVPGYDIDWLWKKFCGLWTAYKWHEKNLDYTGKFISVCMDEVKKSHIRGSPVPSAKKQTAATGEPFEDRKKRWDAEKQAELARKGQSE